MEPATKKQKTASTTNANTSTTRGTDKTITIATPTKIKSVPEPSNTLYINNLNTKINTKKLRTNLFLLFSMYGEVIKITINFKKERGQAFILFKSIDDANIAKLALNNELLFDKPLSIQFSKKNTII